MSASITSTALPIRIQTLLEERHAHVTAIAKIDDTLTKVGAVLGGPVAAKATPISTPTAAVAKTAAPAAKKTRGRRTEFGLTAEQFVLAFIKGQKKPASSAINAHWKAAGRKGTADNTLTKLVKEKKVSRTPLVGQRGSTFAIA